MVLMEVRELCLPLEETQGQAQEQVCGTERLLVALEARILMRYPCPDQPQVGFLMMEELRLTGLVVATIPAKL